MTDKEKNLELYYIDLNDQESVFEFIRLIKQREKSFDQILSDCRKNIEKYTHTTESIQEALKMDLLIINKCLDVIKGKVSIDKQTMLVIELADTILKTYIGDNVSKLTNTTIQ